MGMNILYKMGVMSIASLSSVLAMSYPLSEINCQHKLKTMKLPMGLSSSQLLFGEACETVYVAPPKAGVKTVKIAAAQTTGLTECPAILNLSKVKVNLTRQMVALSEESARIAERLNNIQQSLDETANQLSSKSEEQSVTETKMREHNTQIQSLRTDLLGLQDQLSNCSRLLCSDLKKQIKEKKTQIQLRTNALNTLKAEFNKRQKEILALRAIIERNQSSYRDRSQERAEIQDRILDTFGAVDKTYSIYSTRHGADLQIEMELNWMDKVDELDRLNPDLEVKALNLEKSQILLTDFDKTSALASMSPVIGRGLPNTNYQLSNQTNQPTEPNVGDNVLYLPAVNLSLSLLGACNFYDTKTGLFSEDIKTAFVNSFSSVVVYSYYTRDNFDYNLQTNIHATIDKLATHFLSNPSLKIEKSDSFLDTWFTDFSIKQYEGVRFEDFRRSKKFNLLRTFSEHFAQQSNEFQKQANQIRTSTCVGDCDSVSMLSKLSVAKILEVKENLKAKYANGIYEEESLGNSYSKQYGTFSF